MPQLLELLWHQSQDRPGERCKFDFIKSCNELNQTQIAHYDTSTLVNIHTTVPFATAFH